MSQALSIVERARQAPLPRVDELALSALAPEAALLAQTYLWMSSPGYRCGPCDTATRLPHRWMSAWSHWLFHHKPDVLNEDLQLFLEWARRSEISSRLLFQLALEALPNQGKLADRLAGAIHPLDKQHRSQALLEFALARGDDPEPALRAADAGPLIAQGGEEVEAIAEALVRLARAGEDPEKACIQEALDRLLKLTELEVDKDIFSWPLYSAVQALREVVDARWTVTRNRLASRIANSDLRHRLESGEAPQKQTVSATALEVESLVDSGQHREALRLARVPGSRRGVIARAFRKLPPDLLFEASTILDGLEGSDRAQALRCVAEEGLCEQAEFLSHQLRLIREDGIRLRCAAECAAAYLERGLASEALDLLRTALAAPVVTDLLGEDRHRIEARVWLSLDERGKALESLMRGIGSRALAGETLVVLAEIGEPLSQELFRRLASQPESFFSGGDPPNPGCVGTSVGRLVTDSQEKSAISFFRGIHDPARKALAAFLRERVDRRGGFDWETWGRHLTHRDKPCPHLLACLASSLVTCEPAQALLAKLPASGTNNELALKESARQHALAGNLERCWSLSERLSPYLQSTLVDSLAENLDPQLALKRLKALPRRGISAVEKEILERHLAQAEARVGKLASAFKRLEGLGKVNPAAPAQLADYLWQRLSQREGEQTPERLEALARALTRTSPQHLAERAARLLPDWLRVHPPLRDFASKWASVLGAEPDQAVLWLSLNETGKGLSQAGMAGPQNHNTLRATLSCAASHPALNVDQQRRFLERLHALHPRQAMECLGPLFSEPPCRNLLLQGLLERDLRGELKREVAVALGKVYVTEVLPQQLELLLEVGLEEVSLAIALGQLATLAYRHSGCPDGELEGWYQEEYFE